MDREPLYPRIARLLRSRWSLIAVAGTLGVIIVGVFVVEFVWTRSLLPLGLGVYVATVLSRNPW